jgi:septum formation protein
MQRAYLVVLQSAYSKGPFRVSSSFVAISGRLQHTPKHVMLDLPRHKLILGSSSRWRAGILRRNGYTFTQVSPDIDEKAIRHADPSTLTLSIAQAKCKAIIDKLGAVSPTLIICSDQVGSQLKQKMIANPSLFDT